MEITRKVVDFIVDANRQRIPEEAIYKAKLAVLDWIGVTLAGSSTSATRILGGLIKENVSHPVATVVGQGFKTSISSAAFVNGTAGHALDYDDTASLSIPFHPSVPILPAVLALGEARQESGKKIIEAYLLGYEIEAKLAEALTGGHFEEGWHATATVGTLGATAAVCKILNLSPEQTRTALGIATSMTGGVRENFGTMTKSLQVGNAARNGTLAGLLAQRGFTASLEIFEGKFGFFKLYGPAGFRIRTAYLENLGKPFSIVSPGLSIKPYPSCRGTHSSIDATLNVAKQNSIAADDVETIECGISPIVDQTLVYSNPKTGNQAKFSLEYCVAVAFFKRKVNLEHFADEKVRDPGIQRFIKRIKRYHLSKGEMPHHLSAKIKIILKNGLTYSSTIDFPKGSPNNPMSKENLIEKFTDCARICLPANKIVLILNMIENIESLRNISELMELLV